MSFYSVIECLTIKSPKVILPDLFNAYSQQSAVAFNPDGFSLGV